MIYRVYDANLANSTEQKQYVAPPENARCCCCATPRPMQSLCGYTVLCVYRVIAYGQRVCVIREIIMGVYVFTTMLSIQTRGCFHCARFRPGAQCFANDRRRGRDRDAYKYITHRNARGSCVRCGAPAQKPYRFDVARVDRVGGRLRGLLAGVLWPL